MVTVEEIERDLGRLPEGRRRRDLEQRWTTLVDTFAEAIAIYDLPAARQTARILVAAQGVGWDAAALDVVCGEAGGYPYFLQQYGQDAWNAAGGEVITSADAHLGVARGQLALDTGFFQVRWDRATTSEKAYLRAMAVDGDQGSTSGEVAARLGKKVTSLGPTRASLIAKGLIYSPDHGIVAYTVPAMAAFVRRQTVDP